MGADIFMYTVISESLCFTLDLIFVAHSLNLFEQCNSDGDCSVGMF